MVRTAPVASATNETRPSGWRCATNAWCAPGTMPTAPGGEPSARGWTTPVWVANYGDTGISNYKGASEYISVGVVDILDSEVVTLVTAAMSSY